MFHNATNQRNMKIEGYENYEVRPNGDVINTVTDRVLKPGKDGSGYLFVHLYKNSKPKKFLIHRLVSQAFIPNPLNLPFVNHKDEDKTNNKVENLEWCTHEYNLNYGTRNERISKAMSKPILQLRKDGSLIRVWSSVMEVEKQLHYNHQNISKCCLGKRHSANGFKWCYAKQ